MRRHKEKERAYVSYWRHIVQNVDASTIWILGALMIHPQNTFIQNLNSQDYPVVIPRYLFKHILCFACHSWVFYSSTVSLDVNSKSCDDESILWMKSERTYFPSIWIFFAIILNVLVMQISHSVLYIFKNRVFSNSTDCIQK